MHNQYKTGMDCVTSNEEPQVSSGQTNNKAHIMPILALQLDVKNRNLFWQIQAPAQVQSQLLQEPLEKQS